MNRTFPPLAALAAGLAALGWIAAGYLTTSLPALAAVVVITAFYVAGALELRRVWRATRSLEQALDTLREPPTRLPDWLATLHPSLQHAARLRVESGVGALPGPALAPYLTGLLVLLGMLGTFLGMVATLRGTGVALETATDIASIRATLAAPVQGLGLAFGTSVAGVAASAMLGLATAFVRRDRQRAQRRLDDAASTVLRGFSRAHRDEAAFALLQRQTDALPALVEQLQAMAGQIERHGRETTERMTATQERVHAEAREAQAALAATLERQLSLGLAESSRRAAEAMQPVVRATLDGLAAEATRLQSETAAQLEQRLEALAQRVEAAVVRSADRSAAAAAQVSERWHAALARHEQAGDDTARRLAAALDAFSQGFESRSAALLNDVAQAQGALRDDLAASASALARQAAEQQERSAQDAARLLADLAQRLDAQADSLLQGVATSQHALQAALAAADEQRLSAWTRAMESASATVSQHWADGAQQAREQQQRICDALERTADAIGEQTAAHARATLAEIERLLQAAAQAPQAAAEVVGGLREQLSRSMARDNEALHERERLLQTVGTLLDAVSRSAGEQREAVERLVASAGHLLEQAGARFAQQVQGEAGRLGEAAALVAAGSADMASLGEAFGQAVQAYGDSNTRLMEQLQRIEGALDRSAARSDEQLAYYVAQARELIELSIASQQRVAGEAPAHAAAGGAA